MIRAGVGGVPAPWVSEEPWDSAARPADFRNRKLRPAPADHRDMGNRAEALELARFLAFDGRDVEQIAQALQVQFGLGEREAMKMAFNVLAPAPEPAPDVLPTDLGL